MTSRLQWILFFNGDERKSKESPEEGHLPLLEKENIVKEPPLFQVILLNDDFTPQDFVVFILMNIFNKSFEEATRIMLEVHHKGRGLCGVFPYEIAEIKTFKVINTAREREFPLKCIMEPII